MADGDPVYSTGGKMAYGTGGKMVYKAAPAALYGKRVTWDGGDVWNSHEGPRVAFIKPSFSSEKMFTSYTDVTDGTSYTSSTDWRMYALSLPGYPSSSRLELRWVNATRCEMRIFFAALLVSRYYRDYPIPSPYDGGPVGTYTFELYFGGGLDIGTVKVEVIP